MLRRKVAGVTQSQCNGSACDGVTPDGNKAAAVLCSVETEDHCNITREELCSDVQVSMQETLTAAAGAQARHNSSNKEAAGAKTVRL